MESILRVHDIRKTFGKVRAVDGVSFEVPKGSITGLLGRNGAGKTTTIRMITGIFYPDEGTIHWEGESGSFQDRVGYLPEERGLYKQMKLMEHVLFLAEIKDRVGPEIRKRAEYWLDRFELLEKKNVKVEELSKGNQQKIQFIGALLHDPDLIILDEPMSGLDPVNVVLVRNIVRDLRDSGKTILLSTHMMGEAEKLANQIVLIHNGKVVLSGPLDQIRRDAAQNHVQIDFDGDASFLESLPGVARTTIHGGTAEITMRDGADSQALLREVTGRIPIRRFEIATPSLEEIFIDRVGAETLRDEEPAA